jgi:YidC/Oxa1 family membrane protein insertase
MVGVGVAAAVFVNTQQARRSPAAPAGPAAPAPPGPPAPPPPLATTPPPPERPAAHGLEAVPEAAQELPPPGPVAAPPGQLTGLRPQPLPRTRATLEFTPLGSEDRAGPWSMRVDFIPLGAGIRAITLAQHFETVRQQTHVIVQHENHYIAPPPADPTQARPLTEVIAPCSAVFIEINGQLINLLGTYEDPVHGWVGEPVWVEVAPGHFEASIVDGEDRRVARLIRQYELDPGSYVLRLRQWVQNLTDHPLDVKWIQFGPIDLDRDVMGYGGDRRRVRFGYLLRPEAQRGDPTVAASDYIWDRTPQACMFFWASNDLLGQKLPGTVMYEVIRTIWPNRRSQDRGHRLVWTGMTNRYFGAALHPLLPGDVHPDQKVFTAAAVVDRVLLQRWVDQNGTWVYDPVMVLRTTSDPRTIAAGEHTDLSMALYAGPLSRSLLRQHPSAAASGLRDLVVYNFGGPCAPCTFGFLTSALLNLLLFLHHYLVFDWALAIIVLVVIVRSLLHPVTRWSQIRLQRFGKQMQDMAPKQKKLQEKYKDDPKRMTEEMRKLWREEGINPAGMLGCVPLLLQTPVWIALFAMLFFAFELRQEAAFFGVFQWIGGGWLFLGDMAEPDRFYDFGRNLFWLPLLNDIRSFNILPLLLGVVFFIQQKYLAPPTTAPLTPEQQQQQRMIKVMMVVLFPLFMYNMPSGLTLYFIVNSSLAIVESKWIRKHIEKHKLLDVKKPMIKPGGFLARLQELAEERQRQMKGRGGQQPPRKKV